MVNITRTCSQLVGCIAVSLTCSCVVKPLYAQEQKGECYITFKEDSLKMGEAMKRVTLATGYVFQNADFIDKEEMVRVKFGSLPLSRFLDALFKGKSIRLDISRPYIGLSRRNTGRVATEKNSARNLKGYVRDEEGPVAGATVWLNGQEEGTTTDTFGVFHLWGKKGDTIKVSCTGYQAVYRIVPTGGGLRIRLKMQSNSLKPFTVKGNKKREEPKETQSDNVDRFSAMEAISLKAQPNMLHDHIGKDAGTIVERSNGRSAASVRIEIRGPTNLGTFNQPLYVINGVILPPELPGGEGTMSQFSSMLSYFSPADIDTIIILKDAVATAAYGARGANGVVLIYTKKAIYQRSMNVIDVSYGFGRVPRKEQLLNTPQYLALRRNAWENDGLQPTRQRARDLLLWDPVRYTDWQDVLIGNTAHYTDAVMTFMGGGTRVQYLLGINCRNNSSVFMDDENNYGDSKLGFHYNTNMKLTKDNKLDLSLTTLANVNTTRLPGTDYTAGITLPANAPPLLKEGKINYEVNAPIVSTPDFEGRVSNALTTANISYRVNQVLDFRLTTGFHQTDARSVSRMTIKKRGTEGQGNITASLIENRYAARTFVIDPAAHVKWGVKADTLNVILGATYNSIYATNKTISASGFKSDRDMLNYRAATMVDSPVTWNRYRFAGLYTDINNNWKGKYTLQVIVRIDASSRFGKDKQVNVFGGGALGWEFGKEGFMQKLLPHLGYGKLQVGWSKTGNDQIGDYQDKESYQQAGIYQGVEGLAASRQRNDALTGGVTERKDITMYLKFFDNKLEIEAAYYHNLSRDQPVEYPLPEMAGGGMRLRNMPVSIRNTGVEATLNANPVRTRHWDVRFRVNVSKGTNMLVSFPGMVSSPAGQTLLRRPVREGFYFNFCGVDAKTGAYTYKNSKGDTVNAAALTDSDRTVAVNTAPRFYGGWGGSVAFHGFELSFSGQYMVRMAEKSAIDGLHMPGTMWNQPVDVLDRWYNTGDNAAIQRATQSPSSEADYKKYLNSTAMFDKIWYIRFNNVTAAWQFKKYRVYCNASNLITFTNYRSLDPETLTNIALPPLRVITFGIQYHFK